MQMRLVGNENNAQFSNSYFPSKIQIKFKWEMQYFCDENWWNVMHDYDRAYQDGNVTKRTIPFGLLMQKLCKLEVQNFLAMIDP